MHGKDLERLLQHVGLSEREAKVYLAALSLGPSSVLQLSNSAGINRTTTYSIIESLQHKGLISIETSGFKRKIVAENPQRLDMLIDNQKQLLQQGLPDLLALHTLKGKESFIRSYTGIKGLKAVYQSMLEKVPARSYYYVIGHTDLLLKIEKDFFEKFIQKRSRIYKDIRLFLRDTPLVRRYTKQTRQLNFSIKLLSAEMDLQSVLILTPERAVIHQLGEPFETLVIENLHVIELLSSVFRHFWNEVDESKD